MILIGLGAKARQGKNYVGNYMKEAIPDIKFYSFADQLKIYCKEFHDELVPQWQLAKQTKHLPIPKDDPIYGYTAILQWFGTEVMRKNAPDHWVHCVEGKILFDKPEIAIITDVRFKNEANWIRNHDGWLVEIIRLNEDGTRYFDPNRDSKHPSEVDLDDYNFDFTILARSGDLTALKSKALGVLKNIITNESQKISDMSS